MELEDSRVSKKIGDHHQLELVVKNNNNDLILLNDNNNDNLYKNLVSIINFNNKKKTKLTQQFFTLSLLEYISHLLNPKDHQLARLQFKGKSLIFLILCKIIYRNKKVNIHEI
jgi:hypothetical protein